MTKPGSVGRQEFMSVFRLMRKHVFPLAVPCNRRCRWEAGPLIRGPVGWREGFRTSSLRPGGGAQATGGLNPDAESFPREAYTMHTIVLADDHPVVRQSLKKLLNQQADLHLVAESGDGLETLNLVRQLQPDLLVTDLMMPGMNGLEVTRRIRLSFPATRVVVVSVNGDEPYVAGALRCGAIGFVLKSACGRHLLPAVRAALAGERFVSPPLADPTL